MLLVINAWCAYADPFYSIVLDMDMSRSSVYFSYARFLDQSYNFCSQTGHKVIDIDVIASGKLSSSHNPAFAVYYSQLCICAADVYTNGIFQFRFVIHDINVRLKLYDIRHFP